MVKAAIADCAVLRQRVRSRRYFLVSFKQRELAQRIEARLPAPRSCDVDWHGPACFSRRAH